jgi:hypothetical protein
MCPRHLGGLTKYGWPTSVGRGSRPAQHGERPSVPRRCLELYLREPLALAVRAAQRPPRRPSLRSWPSSTGHTTKRYLSGPSGILFMGLIGVILASLVALALQVSIFALPYRLIRI